MILFRLMDVHLLATFFTLPYFSEHLWGAGGTKEREKGDWEGEISPSSYKATNPNLGVLFSWPHLVLITSQRPHLQILSHGRDRASNIWRGWADTNSWSITDITHLNFSLYVGIQASTICSELLLPHYSTSIVCLCVHLLLNSLSILFYWHVYMVSMCTISHCLDDCSFVLSLEVRSC